jgi:hypothetical protein
VPIRPSGDGTPRVERSGGRGGQDAAGIAGAKGAPLFRTLDLKRKMTETRMSLQEALDMNERGKASGLGENVCHHNVRATGITAYLEDRATAIRCNPLIDRHLCAAFNCPQLCNLLLAKRLWIACGSPAVENDRGDHGA